jgi:hypothetical protein
MDTSSTMTKSDIAHYFQKIRAPFASTDQLEPNHGTLEIL